MLLLKKQGNSTFCKVVKQKGRDVLASKKPSLVQLPCAKTREFGFAEFSDCLPVSALVCVFAFDTGGLGLWLGAFGRSRLYRCQSVPGPPMPCFVTQSFAFASGNSCFNNSRVQKLQNSAFAEFWDCTPVSCFTNAVCQSCKKRCFLRQFAGFRFGAFLVVQEWGWRTSRGVFCVVFMWFLRGCGAGLGARGSRVFVSFFIYFICSPTNDSLLFLFSGC